MSVNLAIMFDYWLDFDLKYNYSMSNKETKEWKLERCFSHRLENSDV